MSLDDVKGVSYVVLFGSELPMARATADIYMAKDLAQQLYRDWGGQRQVFVVNVIGEYTEPA